MSTPCIACIGVIGKHDNPLHIAIFPPYKPPTSSSIPGLSPKHAPQPSRDVLLEFSFLLNASLDIFDARARDRTRIDQDLGLLQHIDERLSIWGWLTSTGIKFAIIVDAWGKDGVSGGVKSMLERTGTAESVESLKGKKGGGKGGQKQSQQVGDADLRPAFKALQTAWIRLVGSPFYAPEDRAPMAAARAGGNGGGEITSKRFLGEVRRIGEGWRPGLTTL